MYMKGTLDALRRGFESSSERTPEFAAFARTFKREFKKQVEMYHAVEAWSWNVGHFEVSGFFKLYGGKCFYFNTGDVRGSACPGFLIRSARDFKDYTGGANNWARVEAFDFMMRLPAAFAPANA